MTPEVRAIWLAGRTKHGAYADGGETAEHYIWRSMIARCRTTSRKDYRRYGGRGITVCKRWYKFENFLADMGNRPSPKHSLDRRNNDAGYSPDNCEWATRESQQTNKANTKFYFDGYIVYTLTEAAASVGISTELAWYRFKNWGTFEKGKIWQLLKSM